MLGLVGVGVVMEDGGTVTAKPWWQGAASLVSGEDRGTGRRDRHVVGSLICKQCVRVSENDRVGLLATKVHHSSGLFGVWERCWGMGPRWFSRRWWEVPRGGSGERVRLGAPARGLASDLKSYIPCGAMHDVT